MQYLLLLSKQDIELAKEEAVALLKPEKAALDENLLIIELARERIKLARRLAYTNAVYQLLFISLKNLERDMQNFSWQAVYKKDFCLRFRQHETEPKLAGYIWDKLQKPKVNLERAATQIELFKTNKVYCCLLLFVQKENFEKRKPHLRPGFMPVSLHPKLARCLVNLTGIEHGLVLDPFCGTGGILIEAGLIGLKTKGYDSDKRMIDKCRQNLDYYRIKKYQLVQRNALNLEKTDYIATDLPYGISTKKQDFKKLYRVFFKALEKQLGKRAVIVVPNSLNTKPLTRKLKFIKNCWFNTPDFSPTIFNPENRTINSSGFSQRISTIFVVKEFLYYIHKNLTKKIVIVEQK